MRCARSCAPRLSTFRAVASSSGASISAMGRAPRSGKRLALEAPHGRHPRVSGVQPFACLPCHSSATASKLLASRSAASRFSTLR